MDRHLLTLLAWLLLLGGLLLTLAWGVGTIFGGLTLAEMVLFVAGGGFYLLASAIVLYIRKHVASS